MESLFDRVKLWQHHRELKRMHHIALRINPFMGTGGSAESYTRRITLASPVRNERTYATFMHELGHVVSPGQKLEGYLRWMQPDVVLHNEADAWEWARKNAIKWTAKMELHSRKCFDTYYKASMDPMTLFSHMWEGKVQRL